MTHRPRSAFLDPATGALVVHALTVTDHAVVTEAQHWAEGRRGHAATADVLADADLAAFVTQAITVGAHALAHAGGSQQALDLQRLVTDLAGRAETSAAKAAEATSSAARTAGESLSKAADDARKAITETLSAGSEAARAGITKAVEENTAALRAEIDRLLGGENPELAAKLTPVLDGVGRRLGEQAFRQTDQLLTKITRQFDPADPTSPFAKQAAVLGQQHETLTRTLTEGNLALVAKVDELAKAVDVAKAAAAATGRTASVTPLKGATFEGKLNAVLSAVAAGLAGEYTDTSTTPGAIARCKKGDGVLTIDAGAGRTVRIVVEAHDALDRRDWIAYLDEAERNRDAVVSLGVVRTVEQNQGQTVRVLGSRRIVLAHDPDTDPADMLRAVVQVLGVAALAVAARRDDNGVATAEEHVTAARELLTKLDAIRKHAGAIRKGADGVEAECNTVQTGITRHLGQALDALAGVPGDSGADVGPAAAASATPTAAADSDDA